MSTHRYGACGAALSRVTATRSITRRIETTRSEDEMTKRVVGLAVGSVLAGAALAAGVPTLALADEHLGDQSSGSAAEQQHMREMGTMMSNPEVRQSMTTMMSQMMSDPELRDHMVSMMSEAPASMGE
jgi:hypothetical protein